MQSTEQILPVRKVKRLPQSNIKLATVLSFMLIPLSGLVTDIYIPSMPHMAAGLGVSENAVQLTLSFFLVSYGLAQFLAGSLIDSYGRYRLTLMALVVFIFSNIVITFTRDISVIYAMRVIQGLTTGIIVVAKRAFFVDVFDGEKRKHYLSIMSIVWSSAPVVAPFIGGYLQQYFHWQSNFMVLAGYGFLMLILELVFSGETIREYRAFNISSLLRDYKIMLGNRLFVCGLLICGLCYGTTMVFGLSGAFIIEHKMNYPAVVAGYASLIMGLAWMSGGFIGKAMLSKSLLPKLKVSNLLHLAIAGGMVALASGVSNLYSLVAFAFLVHVCVGFIFNNFFAVCLGLFPQMAGLTSGMSGGIVFIVTSITSYSAIGAFHPKSQYGLGWAYITMGLLVATMLYVVSGKIQRR